MADASSSLSGTRPPTDLPGAMQQASSLLLRPTNLPKMPWEMAYEERRRSSKDPRIMKQIAEEDQWVHTTCSSIWRRIRVFALPKNDWIMSKEQFLLFIATNGVKGPQFMAKAVQVFDPKSTGVVNGLIACKHIHLALTTPPLCEMIARHCFERYDRPLGEDYLSVATIEKCKLLTPAEVAARSSKKGKKGNNNTMQSSSTARPEAMVAGARYDNVELLKALIRTSLPEGCERISMEDFLAMFLDQRNGEWVGSFIVPIMECLVKYCSVPTGSLPLIPLRWLKSVEPLAPSGELFDADVVMLREIELTGIDPTQQANGKKKKGRSASPKKKGGR